MNKLLPLLMLTACDGGLARLWQAPPPPDAGPRLASAPAVGLVGRIGLAAFPSAPEWLEPSPGDRLRAVEARPLGEGLWLVRSQIPMPKRAADEQLELALGYPLGEQRLRAALRAQPRASLGLALDPRLNIVADKRGEGRRGRVLRCDGDPVQTKLELLACLVLAEGRSPALTLELPTRPASLDAGPAVSLDAGPQAALPDAAVPAARAASEAGPRDAQP